MLIFYKILSYFFLVISPIIIIYRIIIKKENKKRFLERYGFKSTKRKKGLLIWFHCSSVGELISIIPLLEKFESNKKIKQILLTTTTVSSSYIIKKLYFKKVVHQFFPIDNNLILNNFIEYWKPSVFFLCESEIWPNLIFNIHSRKIKLVLVNGRMTSKSFYRWKKFKEFSSTIFKKFDLCLVQNNETKKRLSILGAKNILSLGNLKFSLSNKIKSGVLDKKILNFFKNKKILIIGASTHLNEENFIIQNHNYFLKHNYKNLVSIIIPRHVERALEIKNELEKFSLNAHFHSDKNKVKKNTNVYIVDTYGEANKFYKISNLVFMGGSLIKHGGQNPLEPARFGCKIIHGPHIDNFKEIYKKLEFMNISEKFENYASGTKIIKKKYDKKRKTFDNKKIIHYGEKVLNSTYSKLVKLI